MWRIAELQAQGGRWLGALGSLGTERFNRLETICVRNSQDRMRNDRNAQVESSGQG